MNPYKGADFFSFFTILAKRLFTGILPLASDEKQLIVFLGVALSCAIVGGLLVLRRMTMMANAISHTVLLGIVAVFLIVGAQSYSLTLPSPLFFMGALIAAVLTVVLFKTVFHLQEDASIGLVFTGLFAISILLITKGAHNVHLGVEVIMGSGDLLVEEDIQIVWMVALFNLGIFLLFFKEYKLSSFDEVFGATIGLYPRFFFGLLMLQSAFTTVAALRAVGVVIVLAFMVTPALIAKRYAKNFNQFIVISIASSFVAVFLAVALSRHILSAYSLGLSTSGIASCLLAIFYIILQKKVIKVSSFSYG
ncbi:MAG: metal ABC transporter permease [Chlamydiae bacterium]|nr:metal ABC transporter permease [Chlamydiota bacterium]